MSSLNWLRKKIRVTYTWSDYEALSSTSPKKKFLTYRNPKLMETPAIIKKEVFNIS